ncbi:MAG: hypothetical protein K2O86_00910, partial [Clostridia bacterium]|nr:hypothetical protein [Clostridia bacterium]
MNSKTLRAKYLKFVILIISVCIILGAISACLPFNISIPTLDNDSISALARPTTPTTNGFSYFNDGVKYVFTDRTKVDDFRAGTEDFDITTVTVKSSDVQGTQTNPHVITSIDEWEIFVKKMATDSTYGRGQYYVLAKDLDFDGIDFHPVVNFSGTFYGLGYSLKNITCENWQYWTGSAYASIGASNIALGGFGVFCRLLSATVTDLIVQDFIYQNTPTNQAMVSGHGPYVGGVVGLSYGNDNILNCHTVGEITSNIVYPCHVCSGGIVGMNHLAGTSLFLYRCSSEIDVLTNTSSSWVPIVGMIGYNHTGNAVIYDCVANIRLTHSSTHYNHAGVVSGWQYNSTQTVENIVGTIDITTSARNYTGALCGTANRNSTIKNVYVEGKIGATDATKNSIYAVTSNAGQLSATNVSNINVVKSTSNYSTLQSGSADGLPAGTAIEYNSLDIMNATAKTFFENSYSQIWDKDKIGGSYDPNNSPVRNYLVATITFKNLLSEDKEQDIVSVPTDDYMQGDVLPSASNNANFASYIASKTNHVFLGWTMDKTGNTAPYTTTLPSGIFGDVTFYAVWGAPEGYATSNVKTSLSVDKNTIEYDSVASITLTAKVTHTAPSSGAMTNPKPTYYFVQDGDEKTTTADVKSSGVLSVKTVKDSGKYSFKYRLTDGLEPLWFFEGECVSSEEKTITIEKGKLAHMTIKDFKISSSTVPYYGKELKDVDFSVKMYNNANKEVELATETP